MNAVSFPKRLRPMRRVRGRGMFPPPVACAEFAGGEKIRMSFYQPAGRPWRFNAARGMLAQVIGNERARRFAPHRERDATEQKVIALLERPGTKAEGEAASAALYRIKRSARAVMETLADKLDRLPRTNAWPPATDFVDFYIEQDGRRVDAVPISAQPKQARLPATVAAPVVSLAAEKAKRMSSKDYDVAVRYHLNGEAAEAVEKVRGSSTTIALKLARRALRMSHPAAVIEGSEIVFPHLPPGPVNPFARVEASEMTSEQFQQSAKGGADEIVGAPAQEPVGAPEPRRGGDRQAGGEARARGGRGLPRGCRRVPSCPR